MAFFSKEKKWSMKKEDVSYSVNGYKEGVENDKTMQFTE